MLNRLATTSLSLLLAFSSYACGDDDESDDGTTVDAGDDDDGGDDDGEPDAGDGADASVDDVPAITDPEGGQILFEYITFDSQLSEVLAGGAPTALRVMAYFMDSQTPESNPLPTPEILIDGCVNLYETGGWPLGAREGVEGQKRAEVDVGDLTISGQNTAGKDVDIAIPLGSPKTVPTFPNDDFARTHDVFYQLKAPNADEFVQPDSRFNVTLSGGKGSQESVYEDATYMAGLFEPGEPGLEDDEFGLGTKGDVTVTWNAPEEPNQNQLDKSQLIGGGLLTAVVLGDLGTGAPVMFCPVPAAQGEFTITADVVASFRESIGAKKGEPVQAYMLRNNIAHTLLRLNNGEGDTPFDTANKRRIDVVSVQCLAQQITVGP
jgi:hypothetical protein